MTITLSTARFPSVVINQKGRIINKLNSLVGSTNFFAWQGSKLVSRSCSNVKKHNKVMIFLALFVDSHYNGVDIFTSFGDNNGMAFHLNEGFLDKLENTLDGINSVSDINITIN